MLAFRYVALAVLWTFASIGLAMVLDVAFGLSFTARTLLSMLIMFPLVMASLPKQESSP